MVKIVRVGFVSFDSFLLFLDFFFASWPKKAEGLCTKVTLVKGSKKMKEGEEEI